MSYLYRYTAISAAGVKVVGQLQAANKPELVRLLQVDDLYVLSCRRLFLFSRSLFASTNDLHVLTEFSSTLGLLLSANVALTDALTIMSESNDSQVEGLCRRLLKYIEQGQSLSDAVRREPDLFGPVYPALLALGETTGSLVAVLRDMEGAVRRQTELRQRVRQLLLYPAFTGTVLFGVILFLMVYVVPQLVSFIESAGGDIPLHTRVLIYLSGALQAYWVPLIVLAISTFLLLCIFYQYLVTVRAYCDSFMLSVYLIGPILLKLKLSDLSHHMAVLGRSEVGLLEALALSQTLVRNARLESALLSVRTQVLEGSSLAEAMKRDEVFPGLFCNLIRIGESSGELASMFEHVSDLYQREARISMSTAEQLVGPLMITGVGGVLLWVIVSVLSPVYDAVVNVGVLHP